ncbi:MAG: pyrroloquinoline quinone precursor peptide PqqA [Nitrospira sp.]|nr:pyrroloquinoline quinone precursor peptide PqqA [Nitrospira sp.]
MRKWETPAFTEIRMDAEINGYQQDRDDIPDLREAQCAAETTASQQERPAATT